MKIKFIKDSNTFKKDEVVDIEKLYSDAFIAMGFAEAYTEPKEDPKPKAKTTTTKKTTAK